MGIGIEENRKIVSEQDIRTLERWNVSCCLGFQTVKTLPKSQPHLESHLRIVPTPRVHFFLLPTFPELLISPQNQFRMNKSRCNKNMNYNSARDMLNERGVKKI